MPFIALHKDTLERIDISEIENPRLKLRSGDCICQLCKKPLIVKAGMINRPHFSHYSESECDTDYKYHPESADHREAKLKLIEYLKNTHKGYTNAKFEKEVAIPEIKRVADILVTFPMGWREANEIQLSNISVQEFQERTYDYYNAGIDVVWWLGKNADSEGNRNWCIQTFRYCFCLVFGNSIENTITNEVLY